MYRAPSRRRQLLVRAGVYSVMTVTVLLLVAFLVLVMLGFRFNRDTSQIQQGGLVQFASRPVDAKVTIGSAKLGDLTPSKITVNPGNYDVTMSRSGYKGWSKNVDVKAGEVLWLNYAQLVPENVITDDLNTFPAIAGVKSSPNGDRFAVLPVATEPTLQFVDITGSAPKQTEFQIPREVLPADKTPSFELLRWANDSDRMLVKMSYDSTVQYLLVDRRDAKRTVNVSAKYEAQIAEIQFDPRSSERLIIRTNSGDLRTINTANDSLSSVIASSVTGMSLYGNDAVLLVQAIDATSQSVGYVSLGSDEVRELKRISSAERTLVDVSSYFSDPYIAIATGAQLEVFRAKSLPSSNSDTPISLSSIHSATLPAPVDFLSLRTGGRFVVAQYAGGVQTYDIELRKQTLAAFKAPVAGELRWLDGYHFYLTDQTGLQVMEFDGANAHTITPIVAGFDAVQSDDGKFIYSFAPKENGFALQRSHMILE